MDMSHFVTKSFIYIYICVCVCVLGMANNKAKALSVRIIIKIIEREIARQRCDRLRQKSWSPSSVSCVAARKIVRRSCLGARPRYNLVVDEDVKKPNKQTNKRDRDRETGKERI